MTTTASLKNINDLSLEEKKSHIKNIYHQTSYFQQLFHREFIEIKFQSFADKFRHEIERLLQEKNLVHSSVTLENLHEHLSEKMQTYNFDDGVNKISSYFYDTDQQFISIYYRFIKFLRTNLLKEPFWFQATPTIRIHCPNAINNHHYPRYHSDISYGHPPEEINIWFPLTKRLNGHGFKILSLENSIKMLEKFDYDFAEFIQNAIHNKMFSKECDIVSQPIVTEYGNLFAFDSRCIHTGEPLTSHTRVSIDIRILPLSQFEKINLIYQGSGRRKILFAPGHCYHLQHSDNLHE